MGQHGKHGDVVTLRNPLAGPTHVVCPACQGQAVVENWHLTCRACAYRAGQAPKGWQSPTLPAHCGACGAQTRPRRYAYKARCDDCGSPITQRVPNGRDAQPLPLWAETSTRQGVLWAVSPAHLTAMRSYIAGARHHPYDQARGTHRLPNADWRSRLPRWAKLARNRRDVLKALDRLDQRFAQIH